jgi:hypothetical protein
MFLTYTKAGNWHKFEIRSTVGAYVVAKSKTFANKADLHKFQTLMNNSNWSDPSNWVHRTKKYKSKYYWILYCEIQGVGRCFVTIRVLPFTNGVSSIVEYKNQFCSQLPTTISVF